MGSPPRRESKGPPRGGSAHVLATSPRRPNGGRQLRRLLGGLCRLSPARSEGARGSRHIAAFAREQRGDRAADAGIRAGDQRDLVEQLVPALVIGCVIHRRGVKIGLTARFARMLLGKRRRGIDARAGLYRRRRSIRHQWLMPLCGRSPPGWTVRARRPAARRARSVRVPLHPEAGRGAVGVAKRPASAV